ncbi:hypothetical protein [Nocardia sp. CDC160]|uniref:hypothetical protein n=1 Tax=Nocardia sp. CDC160 TaxID=3112166 RepID=UPI002DBBCC0E|nr:hypothetical protein [Nocardia sp. CDC160]MEC3919250.1 hypothetical protein [Nocardia sp. CDC160]
MSDLILHDWNAHSEFGDSQRLGHAKLNQHHDDHINARNALQAPGVMEGQQLAGFLQVHGPMMSTLREAIDAHAQFIRAHENVVANTKETDSSIAQSFQI